ncbi:CCA tRNA nucleotidyltransferase [hydrothermal vent metagenome]|uniref:CCA tRNA nucleotidyltransferase n=1 Tax=hydrothermal vent metagenome TaxID=652676 RepID=A0A3B0S0Q1_9ZZZZ
MEVVKQLTLADYPAFGEKSLVKLLSILNGEGATCRMVGGCVRDALLGREIIDIDLACGLPPEKVTARLEKAGVKVIPTGLKHGTITAVIEKHTYEVTTLRRDVETDGRHARVAFTDDWLEDARRRDFTFNALYLDEDGGLYDPCGGLEDLAARRVRFIGDADKRITEDALRILRFFRFAAQIGQGDLDPAGLEACVRNKHSIDRLSGERLAQELFKTLAAENLLPIIKVMVECGILKNILPDFRELGHFNAFVRLEQKLGRCDILGRLSCLIGNRGASTSRHLKLSNKQANTLKKYGMQDFEISPHMDKVDIRKIIYSFGRELFIFALLQKWAETEIKDGPAFLNYAEQWPVPEFPLHGRDLIKSGLTAGPELGEILKKLEMEWVASDFSLSKADLLGMSKA